MTTTTDDSVLIPPNGSDTDAFLLAVQGFADVIKRERTSLKSIRAQFEKESTQKNEALKEALSKIDKITLELSSLEKETQIRRAQEEKLKAQIRVFSATILETRKELRDAQDKNEIDRLQFNKDFDGIQRQLKAEREKSSSLSAQLEAYRDRSNLLEGEIKELKKVELALHEAKREIFKLEHERKDLSKQVAEKEKDVETRRIEMARLSDELNKHQKTVGLLAIRESQLKAQLSSERREFENRLDAEKAQNKKYEGRIQQLERDLAILDHVVHPRNVGPSLMTTNAPSVPTPPRNFVVVEEATDAQAGTVSSGVRDMDWKLKPAEPPPPNEKMAEKAKSKIEAKSEVQVKAKEEPKVEPPGDPEIQDLKKIQAEVQTQEKVEAPTPQAAALSVDEKPNYEPPKDARSMLWGKKKEIARLQVELKSFSPTDPKRAKLLDRLNEMIAERERLQAEMTQTQEKILNAVALSPDLDARILSGAEQLVIPIPGKKVIPPPPPFIVETEKPSE